MHIIAVRAENKGHKLRTITTSRYHKSLFAVNAMSQALEFYLALRVFWHSLFKFHERKVVGLVRGWIQIILHKGSELFSGEYCTTSRKVLFVHWVRLGYHIPPEASAKHFSGQLFIKLKCSINEGSVLCFQHRFVSRVYPLEIKTQN